MKKEGFVSSNPYFFKRILVSGGLFAALLLAGAVFCEAPLQEAAEAWNVPNPSKSAWFLLWTQELVAYGTAFVYIIPGLFIFFLFAPFFIKAGFSSASWFQKGYLVLNVFILFVFFGIITLTVIAAFFRGEYWRLMF